jgi:glycosyltransferase involved in cell wall biosynthesis
VRALILSENAPVPSDRRVWNEARALRAAGWEVVIVCAAGSARHTAPFEVIEGIEIHRYPLVPSRGGVLGYVREYGQAMWRIRRLVRRLARTRRFDVVHACNPPDFLLLAARSLRRGGTRMVFDHHDLVPELFHAKFGWAGPLHRVALGLEQVAFRSADVVLSTNGSYRAIAIGRGRRRADDVFVVRNGPDLGRFRPVEPDPALRRGRPHLIGYLGIMGSQDGVDHALRALAWLHARRTDWHAVLIGEGDQLAAMRELAGRLGLSGSVEFTGWRDDEDICRILSTCDVCLAPDPPGALNDASTMIKIPEYMAMGCAIASYDLQESQVSAAGAALYARRGDPDDLGRCVAALLDDPQARRRMGQEGRARVRDVLAWQHSVPSLLAAYERAVASAAPPGLLHRDGLGQVPRLVDVEPAQPRDPVGQQL